jgi:Tfp pilus assembly protein PilX
MRAIGQRAARRGAFATLQTLVLLAFLMAMIAAAMRHNVAQRKYLRLRQDSAQAFRLAESGVEEALHRLSARPEGGTAERRLGRGNFRVDWRPAGSDQDVFEVVSTGWARTGEPGTPRRTVRVKAALTRSSQAAAWSVRVLSWRTE